MQKLEVKSRLRAFRHCLFLIGRLQHFAPAFGHDGESVSVGCFERDHDAAIGFKEKRHIGQRVADGDGFDEGAGKQVAFVGDERQGFIGGETKRLALHLFPDSAMDAVGIARSRRKRIGNEQMDTAFEKIVGFVDECLEGLLCGLVSRGDDFDDGDEAIAGDVAHGDGFLFSAIEFGVDFGNEAGAGARSQGGGSSVAI